MQDLPIVCTLTDAELEARKAGLLAGLVARAGRVVPVEAGYALEFPAEDAALERILDVVRAERRCCRFLRFALTVPPGGAPFVLEVTGPEGTQAFLKSLMIEP